MRLRCWLTVLCLLVGTAPLAAQPALTIAFTQSDATPADAMRYIYRFHLDGDTTGVILQGVTCSYNAALITDCQAPFPQPTNGAHRVYITGENLGGVSPPSEEISFLYPSNRPTAPTNLRILRGTE